MAAPLLLGAGKVGVSLIGSLISGGARPLQNVDRDAIDAMYQRQDYVALYHVMYDHQSGNADPAATMWRSKAREYASQKFQQLQRDGVTVDQSLLYVREMQRIADGEPVTDESGRVRVVSSRPGPDYRAPVTLAPASTVESVTDAVRAAAARGDAAALAELNTRLSLGTAGAAAAATRAEQQASILGPLANLNLKSVALVGLVVVLFVLLTRVKRPE